MAKVGLVSVQDAATGELSFFDFGARGVAQYNEAQRRRDDILQDLFKRAGISHIHVKTDDQDYAAPLINYFKIRSKRG